MPFTARQPDVRLMPFAKDEEAVELERIDPPESRMPLEDARPAVTSPPDMVEVAVAVISNEPPLTVKPLSLRKP